MPDYSPHHGSPGGPWKHPPAYPPQTTQYTPVMRTFDRAHPFQPDFYSSMHYPSIGNAPPHMSTVGRTDSSGSSGDKTPRGNHGSQVPEVIGSNIQSDPQVFRSPPVGYGEYPYVAQFLLGGPSSVQPMPTYSHYPPPPCYPPQTWSAMTPPSFVHVEYIAELGPEDVLSGRGGATNSYKGNRSFRSLVKKYQPQYLKAKKRDKPAVASIIVELIREKGGRFLRRCDNKHNASGSVLWVDIGDDRAREKTVSTDSRNSTSHVFLPNYCLFLVHCFFTIDLSSAKLCAKVRPNFVARLSANQHLDLTRTMRTRAYMTAVRCPRDLNPMIRHFNHLHPALNAPLAISAKMLVHAGRPNTTKQMMSKKDT